ncbi:unnamed protein product, partial [Polarella glacialis]
MARYVASLSEECIHELTLTGCGWGIILAQWNLALYPSTAGRPMVAVFPLNVEASTLQCSEVLRWLRKSYKRLQALGESAPPMPRYFEQLYSSYLKRCSARRGRELHRLLPQAAHAFSRTAMRENRLWVHTRPRIGVILALSKDHAYFYGRALGLWRCYCARHRDCEVVVEWENFLKAYPYRLMMDEGGHIKPTWGLSWNRWFALQRHLDAYEWVFSADPDQFVSQQCFASYSLSDALRAAGALDLPSDGGVAPVLVARDFPRFHTLNSASVFLRGGDAGKLFLSLLFSRLEVQGLSDWDQSAWDQTMIEFLDLWKHAQHWIRSGDNSLQRPPLGRLPRFESTRCMEEQYLWIDSTASLDRFTQCWHDFVDELFGAFGARKWPQDAPLRLLDPETADINFVIGNRDTKDNPVFWHLAGKLKYVQ